MVPASRYTKAGHDLVKDQQCTVGVAKVAQPLKEARNRGHQSHVARHRFHDDGGDVVRVGLEQGACVLQVVVFRHQGQLGQALWYTRGIRSAQGQSTRARAHQKRVTVSVVAAVEFDDAVAPRGGSGKAGGGKSGFRATVH